jgi:hypothetical protein
MNEFMIVMGLFCISSPAVRQWLNERSAAKNGEQAEQQ